ncbi:hypothetical protein BKG82_07850 [Mycobacteroides chelonae]|uniref:Uncharacterized protein n=1 Tax=Mycobacteroides chelonae TaxID=1774 RepID=A0A1S1LZ36_MYCCH|nr:hypothetical protein [Mycobacteroides chelonae]OHU60352.1 hypothetical protein BKG82_07850 [Mycobacteroides chelonae]
MINWAPRSNEDDEIEAIQRSIDEAREGQPGRIAKARDAVAAAKARCLEEQPWFSLLIVSPTYDSAGGLEGVLAQAPPVAYELFGKRLAVDLIANPTDARATIDEYTRMVGVTEMTPIAAAALVAICTELLPEIVARSENRSYDFEILPELVEMGLRVWEARAGEA